MGNVINWRFIRHAFSVWKKPLLEDWKRYGFWSIVRAVPTYTIMYFLIGGDEMSIEARILIATSLGWGITELCRYLYLALNAPFVIIKEQDRLLEEHSVKVDKDSILFSLRIQRRVGTEIRNEGSSLVHIDSVQRWKEKLGDWKDVTANIIASLDKEQAEKWKTLTNYVPKMGLRNPLSPEHNALYAQYSERLDRLDKVTEYLKDR